ncbi:sterol desaturase family protein [Metabacillus halosaccharovorans]|uniref:Sterol desaturase family protein n=1 Tax=Metabacillus halosaccharovorans TaxID=930124 RepID=A0ABT3DMJ5_9BACI|nr:sterol desaturase family protein [Metabacillus halosaccharovorans]MCV9888129.1 sterol desaturase family protein [Metabacillus halosaccharovorans]
MILLVKLVIYFLIWSLYSYVIHRIAHIPSKKNPLLKIHLVHHRVKYDDSFLPEWPNFFFWFGSWRASLDVWITLTFPVVIIAIIDPVPGVILLVFHYFYEVFLAGNVVDHNPNIKGRITRYFAIGQYHVRHHEVYRANYGFFITLWDRLFGTVHQKPSHSQKLKNKDMTQMK